MDKRLFPLVIYGLILLSFVAQASAGESFFLYQENYFRWFHASGWMGNTDDLSINSAFPEDPYLGKTCVKIDYSPKKPNSLGWAGIYWQYPVNNWGTEKGRSKLKGVRKLTLFAKGQKGGETILVRIGGLRGKDYSDSDMAQGKFILTDTWKKYTLDLREKDLSHIIGGFLVIFENASNPEGGTIFLDEIEYHK